MNKQDERVFRGLCSDTTFKYLWKNERTRAVLEDIILKTTDIDISGYELIDNELDLNLKTRVYVMDIVLKKDEKIINIEMNQKEVKKYVMIRNHTYLYALLGSRYQKGESFTKRKVTQINFNMGYCSFDKRIDILKANLSDIDKKIIVDDNICDYEIYLSKFKNICYNKDIRNLKESYLSMFTAESIEQLIKIIGDNKEMKILVEELERLNEDENFSYMYDKELIDKKVMNTAYDEGKEEGIGEGIKQARIENAITMIEDGLDINKIAEYTNMTIENIKKIKEEINYQ